MYNKEMAGKLFLKHGYQPFTLYQPYTTSLEKDVESLCDHMPFNTYENAIYGHLLGPHFANSVRSFRHQPDRGDVASVDETSQSRMRAAYVKTQRIVQQEFYACTNERMWTEKQG